MKLEHAVKTGSLPDDAKIGVSNLGMELAAAKLTIGSGNMKGHVYWCCL